MIKKPLTATSGLDEAIENVLAELRGFDAESDEFAKVLKQLTKLYKLKALEKPDRVSKDTIALIIANLVGIAMIVGHERTHVITSKALSIIRQLR